MLRPVGICKVFIISCLSILFTNYISAKINSDSIAAVINKAKAENRPALYLQYADSFSGNDNLKAVEFGEKAFDYYHKSGDKIKEADALSVLAEVFWFKNDFDKAINNYQQAVLLYLQKKDKKKVASRLNNIGRLYSFKSQNRQAIYYYLQSLKYSSGKFFDEMGTSYLYYGIDLRYLSQPDSAIDELNKAVECFNKSENKKELSKTYYYMGLINFEKNLFQKAIDYYRTSDSLRKEIGDLEGRSKILANIGNVYNVWGQYEKAISAYQDAIRFFETINYSEGIASCLSNIGMIYNRIGEEENSLKSHNQALQIRKERKDYLGISKSLNNIAIVKSGIITKELARKYGRLWADFLYKKIGQQTVLNLFKDVITDFNQALSIEDSLKDLNGIAESFYNIGTIYANAGYFAKADDYYKKAIDICNRQNNTVYAAVIKISVGYIHVRLSDFKIAQKYYEEALQVFKQKQLNNYIKVTYDNLSLLFEAQGDNTKALYYYKLYTEVKDTLLNAENYKQLVTQRTQFETEAKEHKIKILEKDTALKENRIKQQLYFIIFFILLSIMVGALVVLFYRQSKQRKLTNQQLEIKNALISGQKKEITDSIQYASRLQQAILPPDEVLAQFIPDHFIFFRPRDIVSGDFYYVAEKDEKIVVVTADCTGHGVPGALMSMIGTSILNEIINKHDTLKPDVILNEMRLHIIKSLHQSGKTGEQRDGMDLALYILDRKKNILDFAGANNPLIVVRKGEIIEMKPDKMPIGIYEKGLVPFNSKTLEVLSSDMLYTFSDGICDQFGGPEGKKFLSKRLKEVLINIHTLSVKEQKAKIDQIFHEWRGDHEQVDDVLIIGVRV